jgi:D-aminopeptidase
VRYDAGPLNSITDVPGVQVAHLTRQGPPPQAALRGIRTGLTAIFTCPLDGRFARPAAVVTIGGRVEATGLNFIDDFGFLTNPIVATSMRALGRVYDAILSRSTRRVVLGWPPVIVGFDDGRLSDQRHVVLGQDEIAEALDTATNDKVTEGAVGAGAGLVAFGFKSGVGSSSRRLIADGTERRLGALVLLNLGGRANLIAKTPGRAQTTSVAGPSPLRGSALVVIATDAPLDDRQCKRVATMSLQGLGRIGSVPGAREGIVLCAVSTGVQLARNDRSTQKIELPRSSEIALAALADAAIEATEAAGLRSLTAVGPAEGTKDYPAISPRRIAR